MNDKLKTRIKEIIEDWNQIAPEETERAIVELVRPIENPIFEDRLFISWTVSDIKAIRPNLTDTQAKEVLRTVESRYEPSEGICYETIRTCIDFVYNGFKDEEVEQDE